MRYAEAQLFKSDCSPMVIPDAVHAQIMAAVVASTFAETFGEWSGNSVRPVEVTR